MKKRDVKLERIFGIILLLPPILSVLLFFLNLFFGDIGEIVGMENLSYHWTGSYGYNYSENGGGGGGGYTSAAPIYLGLMAIAGALLLKGTDKE